MIQEPEDAVERAMVAIRRRQSRRILAQDARQQGFSSNLLGTAEILNDLDEAAARGSDRTVTGIAGRLRMDQPRVSRLVAGAIDNGLLDRLADQGDGRRSVLALTEAGDGVLAGIRRNRRFQFEQAMADWSADERATFADLLTRFVAALE
jgi:DNA-binding MarR family transcriptional regulator